MRKHKKDKHKNNLQNCVGLVQDKKVDDPVIKNETVNSVEVNSDLETLDVRVDSILSDGKDVELDGEFKVEIPRNVYYKLLTYCKLVDDEISGLGYVERIGANAFKVSDVYLLKQKVSAVTCDLDVDAQCQLMQELITAGKNPSNLKFWWHSHAKMGASWSTQDEKTGKHVACDYYISLVINHSGEMRCRLNIYQPIELEIDNVKVVMIDSEDITSMIDACKEEIKQKVFKEASRVITGYSSVKDWHEYHRQAYDMYGANENINSSIGESKPKDNKDLFRKTDEELSEMQRQFYGNHFTVGEHSFIWDEDIKMYNVHDKNNRKLSIDEIETLGLMKYADPSYFENDANEEVEKAERTILF